MPQKKAGSLMARSNGSDSDYGNLEKKRTDLWNYS